MSFQDRVRVGVKLEGSKRYNAVIEEEGYILVSENTNKIYHSYFNKEQAKKLVKELEERGYDCKIM